ncbi:MAG: hypothetical protein ACRBN8_38715 [Nannocystales bacterium]
MSPALLEDTDAQILIAEADGEALGYLVAKHERREHPMVTPRSFVLIDALAVSAKVWRRGPEADGCRDGPRPGTGTEPVELTVRSFNREAIVCYEALGFGAEPLRMSLPNREPDA